jgi:carbon monoxide dehydrogenase subunit G
MNIHGEIIIDAPREAVFDRLRDAKFFASCVEGVHDLQALDDDHYSAIFETKVAYMRFKFNVTVEVTNAERPDRIEARISGRPLGIVGQLIATSTTTLVDVGSETRVQYSIDAALTGKLGSIGQPVLKAKAREMEQQFTQNIRAAFQDSLGGTGR